jgi:membrane associated rhomboid family serine protease
MRGASFVILGATIAVYVLQMVLGPGFTGLFMLIGGEVLSRPWTLVTSMFLHSPVNTFHIVFNMLMLFFFGPVVESRIGTQRFVSLYFGAGILAAIFASFFYDASLGASGALMGVLGVAVILMPDMRVMLWGVVPMTLRNLAILFVVVDIFHTFSASNIATMAHFAGLATGLVYGLSLKKVQKKFRKKFTSKTQLDKDDIEEYLRSGRI